MPKLFSPLEPQVLTKLEHEGQNLANFYKRESSHSVFYSRKVGYFLQILDFEPLVLDGNGIKRPPSEFKEISFQSQEHAKAALCCLNSSLFYWFITVFSDCRHVNKREIDAFPIDLSKLSYSVHEAKLQDLAAQLMAEFQINSEQKRMRFKHDTLSIQCIYPKFSKPIIDEIDRVLAQHYGFTEEELDFIINYDIKYRMGRDADDTAE